MIILTIFPRVEWLWNIQLLRMHFEKTKNKKQKKHN